MFINEKDAVLNLESRVRAGLTSMFNVLSGDSFEDSLSYRDSLIKKISKTVEEIEDKKVPLDITKEDMSSMDADIACFNNAVANVKKATGGNEEQVELYQEALVYRGNIFVDNARGLFKLGA